MDRTAKRLLEVTKNCRGDMHEPDEQGITAFVRGSQLDNAFGHSGDGNEIIVTLLSVNSVENFNLATLIALARIGAKTFNK